MKAERWDHTRSKGPRRSRGGRETDMLIPVNNPKSRWLVVDDKRNERSKGGPPSAVVIEIGAQNYPTGAWGERFWGERGVRHK